MRKIYLVSRLLAMCFVVLWLGVVSYVFADVISVALPEGNAVFEAGEGGEYIAAPEYCKNESPGDPALPVKEINIIVPPDVDNDSISVSLDDADIVTLKETHIIAPAAPFVAKDIDGKEKYYWGKGKKIVNGKNLFVYEKNSFYPNKHIDIVGMDKMRKWNILKVKYYPFRYNPVTKKLKRVISGNIVVNFEKTVSRSKSFQYLSDTILDNIASKIACNYEQARQWYDSSSLARTALTEEKRGYLIMTTSDIFNSCSELNDFIEHKKTMGFDVKVATELDWDGEIGCVGKARSYIAQQYHLQGGIEYVLIIADPRTYHSYIPMKKCYPGDKDEDGNLYEGMTDYYYADLTGNWDKNGDGIYGQSPEDFGGDGISRLPEVIVGRIPYYGCMTNLNSILRKIINYEKESYFSWRYNVLLSMKPSDSKTPGYQLGEAISSNVLQVPGFTTVKVYDDEYNLNPVPVYTPCTIDNVLSAWKNKAGFHFWWTHGSATEAESIFETSKRYELYNSYPSFTFQCSCLNGNPDDSSNLGYRLLEYGAIATVSASNVSWYLIGEGSFNNSDSNAGMTYQYAYNLINEQMPCGYALFLMKVELTKSIWMNHLVFNLYGDPSARYNTSYPKDTTAPSTPIVKVTYIERTNTVYTPSFEWNAYDPGGIAEYQYKLYFYDADIDWPWTEWQSSLEWGHASPGITSIGLSFPFLTEAMDKTYSLCVKARNFQGGWSNVGYSEKIHFEPNLTDTTPPTVVTRTDIFYDSESLMKWVIRELQGKKVESDFGYPYPSRDEIVIGIRVLADDEQSGIKKYKYAIGTAYGGSDIVAWTETTGGYRPFFFQKIAITPDLLNKNIYFISVQVQNMAGVWSNVVVSEAHSVSSVVPFDWATVTNDPISPLAPQVTSFTFGYWGYQHDEVLCGINWDSSDSLVKIEEYHYAIGTTQGGCDILDWQSVSGNAAGNSEMHWFQIKDLLGRPLYASVKAKSDNDLWSDMGFSPVTYVKDFIPADWAIKELTLPQTPQVKSFDFFYWELKPKYVTARIAWESYSESLSKIVEYQYAIGTAKGKCDIANWQSLSDGSDYGGASISKLIIKKLLGKPLYASVKVKNEFGLWSEMGFSEAVFVEDFIP